MTQGWTPRRSGQEFCDRVALKCPVLQAVYFTDQGRVVVIASNFGITTQPRLVLQRKGTSGGHSGRWRITGRFVAEEITGAERDRLFAMAKGATSPYGRYRDTAGSRRIPMIASRPLFRKTNELLPRNRTHGRTELTDVSDTGPELTPCEADSGATLFVLSSTGYGLSGAKAPLQARALNGSEHRRRCTAKALMWGSPELVLLALITPAAEGQRINGIRGRRMHSDGGGRGGRCNGWRLMGWSEHPRDCRQPAIEETLHD